MMLHDDVSVPEQDELPSPREILEELKRKLDKALITYEAQHACGQSVTIRLALKNLSTQSYLICNQDEINDSAFLQFFGLLISIQNTLAPHDKLFFGVLASILRRQKIDKDHALAAYEALRVMNENNWVLLDKAALLSTEQQNFHASVQDLRDVLEDMSCSSHNLTSDIYRYGEKILKQILALKKSGDLFVKGYALFGKESFDTKFYTNVLNVTARVLREPMNIELQPSLMNICEQAPVAQSVPKRKLGGLLCMLLGALVIGFSLGICGVTVGGAAPLAIATVALGVVLIGVGAGIFAGGYWCGLDKSLNGLQRASLFEVASAERSVHASSLAAPPNFIF